MTSAVATSFRRPGASFWLSTRRVAVALAAGVIAFAVVRGYELTALEQAGTATDHLGGFVALDLLLGIVAIGLVPLRRRAPLPITIVIGCLASFSVMAIGALGIAVVSLSTRRRRGEIATAGLIILVSSLVGDLVVADPADDTPLWQVAIASAAGLVILVLAGLNIGGRRELVDSLRERSERLVAEQALRLEQARSGERIRIAREMHDVLAHRLSLVALHSGALAYRDDLSRDQTAETAAVVRDNAHLALTELRDVLGVLRDPGSSDTLVSATTPQPTLAVLDGLFSENLEAGAVIDSTVRPEVAQALDTLSPVQSRHAFRILQEALTNARKHAPRAVVTVVLGGTPGERLEIVVQNPVTEPGDPWQPGHGLVGLAERVRLAGGDSTSRIDDGRFTVRAWLPWTV
ncbi:two-component sensor histidine kinase [Frondihabitans sucicola]|uniref:histidine kinase n=1 Tax=Frondihabitans sucicola TaxID=1268041 RepID=A0ABN6Y486_9MICO|nr:histidine kinase [Frondihabitans sucicola]BDZ50748.1 two-component sensor histidine kinase [Frondihabitans sucicola]